MLRKLLDTWSCAQQPAGRSPSASAVAALTWTLQLATSLLASLRLFVRRRSLVEQEAAKLDVFGVQRQLREGNCELAAVNLSRESELGELRNQIAIVRCGCVFQRTTFEPQAPGFFCCDGM